MKVGFIGEFPDPPTFEREEPPRPEKGEPRPFPRSNVRVHFGMIEVDPTRPPVVRLVPQWSYDGYTWRGYLQTETPHHRRKRYEMWTGADGEQYGQWTWERL